MNHIGNILDWTQYAGFRHYVSCTRRVRLDLRPLIDVLCQRWFLEQRFS